MLQYLKASATDFLGSGKATSLIGVGGGVSSQQVTTAITNAQTREINRIRGYKLQLTPTDNARLAELQSKILEIQEKTYDGTVRVDEYEDRAEYYAEANAIIGKRTLTKEQSEDPVMVELASTLEALMKPKLPPATKARVESLKRIRTTLEAELTERPDSAVLRGKFQTVVQTIGNLEPLRRVEQLSSDERRVYDKLVESINDLAGFKLQLPSKEAMRVTQLERSIETIA